MTTISIASLTFFIVVKSILILSVDYPSRIINIRSSVRVMRMGFFIKAGSDERIVILEDSPTAKSTIINTRPYFFYSVIDVRTSLK